MIPKQSVTHLPTNTLVGHRQNIRYYLSDLDELAASIRASGIIQPIIVTEHPTRDGKWLILAGHRRTAAALKVGMPKVPAIIRHDVTDLTEHLSLMLVENCQRRNLGPVEKAEAIKALIDRGLTKADVARKTGMPASVITTLCLLLDLDDGALERVRDGELTAGEAQAAVRRARREAREAAGKALRGRPVQVEPQWFTSKHPLAAAAKARCRHTTRKKVGSLACGQCWEDAIRDDALSIRGGVRADANR